MKGNTNMNKVCELCEEGKKYEKSYTRFFCLKCIKQYDGLSYTVVDVNDEGVDVGRWAEVISMKKE
jgi:hypothetical protein